MYLIWEKRTLLKLFRPVIRAFVALGVVVWIICMLDLLFLGHFRRAVYIIPLVWIVWSAYKYRRDKKKLLKESVI
jgi:hypothetical protein